MAGYSGTPLGKKLGIKEDHRVLFLNSPDGFEEALDDLPPRTVEVSKRSVGPIDVVVVFVRTERELRNQFDALVAKLAQNGGVWVSWPKKSSGVATDLNFDKVQRIGLDAGLVDNKICAVDDTWSGLRFVIRVENRKKT
jgi:hypothetical protein